ncbi:hypothetical protein WJX84_008116 [Apatococcus fuscideae]|uniref:Kinesin motor domain-containing protein n=1 Tax=Apatococcus fuscideae TaxID=2026836 RepID=A0AAW1TD09_9CHLO
MQGQAGSTSTVVAEANHCKVSVAIKPDTSDAAAAFTQGQISGTTPCVEHTTKRSVTVPYRTGSKVLTFDSVHQGTQDQMSMWEETGLPCFEDTVLGYHPCAIMYVFGAASLPANDDFDQSETITWKVSMVEVYGSSARDLLHPKGQECCPKAGLGHKQGTCLPQPTSHIITGVKQARASIHKGLARRATASTRMNATSSWSHLMIHFHRVVAEQTLTTDSNAACSPTSPKMTSSFTLMDLAGCERQRKTGAEYDSKLLNKAIAINWSLTVLSTVFTQLADPNFSSITTRGNILTEALQDSFTGKGQLVLIAHVSLDHSNVSETASTLEFAQRAGKMQVKAAAPEPKQPSEAEARNRMLEQENMELRQEVFNVSAAFTIHKAPFNGRPLFFTWAPMAAQPSLLVRAGSAHMRYDIRPDAPPRAWLVHPGLALGTTPLWVMSSEDEISYRCRAAADYTELALEIPMPKLVCYNQGGHLGQGKSFAVLVGHTGPSGHGPLALFTKSLDSEGKAPKVLHTYDATQAGAAQMVGVGSNGRCVTWTDHRRELWARLLDGHGDPEADSFAWRVLPIVNTVGQGVVAFHWAPSPSSNLLLVLLRSYLDNTPEGYKPYCWNVLELLEKDRDLELGNRLVAYQRCHVPQPFGSLLVNGKWPQWSLSHPLWKPDDSAFAFTALEGDGSDDWSSKLYIQEIQSGLSIHRAEGHASDDDDDDDDDDGNEIGYGSISAQCKSQIQPQTVVLADVATGCPT